MPARTRGRFAKFVSVFSGGSYSTFDSRQLRTAGETESRPDIPATIHGRTPGFELQPGEPGRWRTRPRAAPSPAAGCGPEAGSIAVDDLSVVSHGQLVEDSEVRRVAHGHHMSVGEQELADAGVVAAELAMPRSAQIVRPLTQIELRMAGDPGEVAREVAVIDRAVSPRRAALAELLSGTCFSPTRNV